MAAAAASAVAVLDALGAYRRVDAGWVALSGLPAATLLGRGVADVTPDLAPTLAPLIAAARAGRAATGELRAARVDCVPLADGVAIVVAPDARVPELLARLAAQLIDLRAGDLDAAVDGALGALGERLGAAGGRVDRVDGPVHAWGELAGDRIGAPLTVAQQAIGQVTFARPGGFPPDAAAAVGLFAEIVAGALDRRRAEDAVRAQVRFEEQLATLSSRLLAAPAEALDAVLADAAPLLGHAVVQRMVASAALRRQADAARRAAFAELERLKASLEHERDYLRDEVRSAHRFGEIEGQSPALLNALHIADAVARTNATVLICGESGAGKELFARAIHAGSGRAGGPLVKVNCANIPRELFESEFFGHVRGAFTGAHRDRSGRFEMAHGGTIFLDEVGEIPPELQAKLLRVLQEGTFERVGDDRTRKVDVRVIAATNRDLGADVAAGHFRADLYYRLAAFPITVPPLRARREDIVPLAERFLAQRARELGRPGLALAAADRERLAGYDWPGNVRELQHVIERAAILSPAPPLRLDLALVAAPARAPAAMTEADLRAVERQNLEAALDRAGGRVAGPGGAAALLGLSPSTLRDRMRAHGVRRAGTVLVVDDDPDLRAFLGDVFQTGTVAVGAVDELDGRAADVLSCDLAILDLDLGRDQPTGVDAWRWLRARGFTGPVAFLTGHPAGHPLVEAARRTDAVRVLEKPARVADLVALARGAR